MILKRFYEEKLAQASFLVGCSATGECAIIDPNRDIAQYLAAAKAENMRITSVTETHIHADFLSGARELAAAAGATIYLSAEGGPDWLYSYANESNVKSVHDGDSIRIGNVRLDILHTPGHTPEHITFLLIDEPASPQPVGAFTGDFIFAGDVGRPDLLEKAAGIAGTMEAGARQLFASLQKFSTQPSHLILWPGHGAGSACGKALGGMPVSTLGYEKMANWAFQVKTEAEFVAKVLEDQPEPPNYFAMMKHMNRKGPAKLDGFNTPKKLSVVDVSDAKNQLLDVRSSAEFAAGYIPGSINVPMSKSFTTWAGSVMSYDQPIHLVASSEALAALAAHDLAMIGFDDVAGWHGTDSFEAWMDQHGPLKQIKAVHPRELHAEQQKGYTVIDVRGASEWKGGHIPGATHVPLGRVAHELAGRDRKQPIVLQCQGGTRSQIALSILAKLGFTDLLNLTGGFGEYVKSELKVSKE